MRDLRRISIIAAFVLIVLRIAIGWQLFDEGLWKLSTQDTNDPWSAEPYLKNSVGPLKNEFRDLTGDPFDRNWLDYQKVGERWDQWAGRFADHYELNDEQAKKLKLILDFPSVSLDVYPEWFAKDLSGDLKSIFVYDEGNKRLRLADPEKFNEESEKSSFIKAVGPVGGKMKRQLTALEQKADLSPAEIDEYRRLAYRIAALRAYGNAAVSMFGQARQKAAGTIVAGRRGELADLLLSDVGLAAIGQKKPDAKQNPEDKISLLTRKFDSELSRFRTLEEIANRDTERTHLSYTKAQLKQAVASVKALDKKLKAEAYALLTPDQATSSRVRDAKGGWLWFIDPATIYGLMVLGGLLIVGLFTRIASFLACVLVVSFYLCYPPFPGVTLPPGPEHALFVNKNLIEALILLALTFLPTGTWFGLDALFAGLFRSDSD